MKRTNIKDTLEQAKRDGKITSYSYEEHFEVDKGGIFLGLFLMVLPTIFGIALYSYTTNLFYQAPYVLVFGAGLFLIVFGVKTFIREHTGVYKS